MNGSVHIEIYSSMIVQSFATFFATMTSSDKRAISPQTPDPVAIKF
jgi:hypothetical protein